MAKKIPSEMSNLKPKTGKPQPLRVLMVEDSEDDVLLIIRELKKGGYDPVYERVETAAAMKKALQEKQWDIILCDYKLPKFNAPSAIAVLKETNINSPLIIVSGTIGEETAVECMRLGAHDYVMKGNLSRLVPAIERELKEAESRVQRKRAESQREAALEALKESEKKYRDLYDFLPISIFEIDTTGTIISFNPASLEFFKYKQEDAAESIPAIQFFEPTQLERLGENIQKVIDGTSIPGQEFIFLRKDGSTFPGLIYASTIIKANKTVGIRGAIIDITVRKQAEEALRESEKKYRELYDFLPIPVYEMDLEANIISVNRAIYETFEGTEEDLKKGFKGWQLLSPEEVDKSAKNIQRLLKGEQVLGTEYTLRRLDGSVFPAIVISSVIYSNDKPVGIRGAIVDITERKQTEESLRKSEEKYRNIIESMQEGYFENDLAGNFTVVNDAECRNLGYPKEELIGMNNRQYQDQTNAQKTYQLFRRIFKTGEPIKGLDVEIIRKNGTKGFNEVSVSLIREAEGKPIGFWGVSRDVTERKQAEKSLRESEERYKALFDRSLDLVYITDFEGRFIDANDAALKRLGYTRKEILSLNFSSLLSEDQLPLALKAIQDIRETGIQMGTMEFRLRHKNGSDVYVETRGSTVISNGTPVAIQAIARDITERKRAEEERKQSFERMRKALRATVQAISLTVEMKDPYTSGHQRRVSDLARAIATEMGLSADRQDFIRTASTIHDIGKISIPSEILSKPTKLTDLEFSLIKTHAQSGYDILKDIEFPWPVADVVLQHHERMDGSGYPQGLKGNDILLEARILAIADVVEAIASHRPYRPALGIDLALKEISGNKGILYDADAVDACLKLFREKGYTLVLKNR